MRRMSLRTVVEWAPREGNKEAGKLANGNAEDFDPSLRIEVSASTLSWDILPEALEAGSAAERQSQAAQRKRRSPRQMQERQTKKTRRASAVEGSMVRRFRKKRPSSRLVNSDRYSTMVLSLSCSLLVMPLSIFVFGFCLSGFLSLAHSYFMYGIRQNGRELRFGQILVRISASDAASSEKSFRAERSSNLTRKLSLGQNHSELSPHQISLGVARLGPTDLTHPEQ